jgi:hypothetical protein
VNAYARVLLVLAAVALLVLAHGVAWYEVSSRMAVPAVVAGGALVVLIVKHLGLLGGLWARLRRTQKTK